MAARATFVYLDELFVTTQGRRQYLWRAVDDDDDDDDGDVAPRPGAQRQGRETEMSVAEDS